VIIGENDPKAAPVYDVRDGLSFVGDDLDKCSISGLEIRLPKLLKASELPYDTEQAGFDLCFEAIHPPFSYHANPDGCPIMAGRRSLRAIADSQRRAPHRRQEHRHRHHCAP
jgi:hypothetical protein